MTESTNKNIVHARDRIEWVDIAKGITIILMIIGHTVPLDPVGGVIYSFHMPLFLVLSGYTFNYENKGNLVKKIYQDFKRLILPVLITFGGSVLINVIPSNGKLNALYIEINQRIEALFWASGVTFDHGEICVLWFLVTLFWIRVIVRCMSQKLEFNKAIIIFFILSMIGMILGSNKIYLPQNFDVVLVGLFFFAIGLFWKKYGDFVEKYKWVIMIFSILVMVEFNVRGIYILLAPRTYPNGILCFIEAIGGTFIMCNISKILYKAKLLNRFLIYIGQGTLLILCIHYIDCWHFGEFWQKFDIVKACVVRVMVILYVFIFIEYIKNIIISVKSKIF